MTTDPLEDHLTFTLDLTSSGGQQCHEDGTLTVPETVDFTGVIPRKIGYRVDIGARESQQIGP
ncbi:MAG: hypothetical protein KDB27_28495 [Planctomycetales bacterium]|nr:hypothetical protein [Planctomycetales bacterium]